MIYLPFFSKVVFSHFKIAEVRRFYSVFLNNAAAAVTALENNLAVDYTNFTVVSRMAGDQGLAVADFQRSAW
jgi:hypothetical protein